MFFILKLLFLFFLFNFLCGFQFVAIDNVLALPPDSSLRTFLFFVSTFISGSIIYFLIKKGFLRRKKDKGRNVQQKVANQKNTDFTSQEKIEFWYSDVDENVTYRTVSVIKLTTQYLEGYCHLREDMRTFRISRIDNEIIDCSTGEIFSKDDWLANHGIKKITTYRKTSDVN